MKRSFKRFLASLLVVVMMITMFPANVLAAAGDNGNHYGQQQGGETGNPTGDQNGGAGTADGQGENTTPGVPVTLPERDPENPNPSDSEEGTENPPKYPIIQVEAGELVNNRLVVNWVDGDWNDTNPSENNLYTVTRPALDQVSFVVYFQIEGTENPVLLTSDTAASLGLTGVPDLSCKFDERWPKAYDCSLDLPGKIKISITTLPEATEEEEAKEVTTVEEKTVVYSFAVNMPENSGYILTSTESHEWHYTYQYQYDNNATPAPISIEWIDNNNDTGINTIDLGERPSIDKLDVQLWATLTDESGTSTKVQITEENREEFGLTRMPEIIKDDTNAFIYKYEIDEKLPSRIFVKVGEDNFNVETETTITYELQPVMPDNYLDTTPETGAQADWVYTVKHNWNATMSWLDNGGIYGDRPEHVTDYFDVYQGKSSDSVNTVTTPSIIPGMTLTIDDNGVIKLNDVPAYDENGDPYQYWIKPKYTIEENGKDYKLPGGDYGYYVLDIENEDNYSTISSALFTHGKLEALLHNTTTMTVTKVWEDGANIANRPNAKMYLYRVIEDDYGMVSAEVVAEASPVQHYDSMDVPTGKDGLAEGENVNEFIVTFMNGTENVLPMYDNQGHRYVYFALETGVTGDYKIKIDNTENTYKYTGDMLSIFGRYILNGGKVTNDQESSAQIPAAKLFVANAMQSMENTAVRFTLQYRSMSIDQNGTVQWSKWENAGNDQLLTPRETDGPITIEINGFTQEAMGQNSESPRVWTYDKNTGAKYEYRWIETAVRINNLNDWKTVSYTEENGKVVYDIVDAGVYGPQVNTSYTSAQFQPTMQDNTTIVNTLVGITDVVVEKRWYDASGRLAAKDSKLDGEKVYFRLYRDGQPVKRDSDPAFAGFEADNDGNVILTLTYDANRTGDAWEGKWENVPRYDAYGRAYVYTVDEYQIDNNENHHFTLDDIVYQNSVIDKDGLKIAETRAIVSNVEDGNGGLEWEVNKVYLDDGDLLSRKPVQVGVYRISDGQLMLSYTLNEGNQWTHLFRMSAADAQGLGYDDFVIKEIAVGNTKVDYYSAELAAIRAKAVDTAFATDNAAFIVGTVNPVITENSDLAQTPEYTYNVYIERNRTTQSGENTGKEYYTIYNQRIAVLSLILTKTWVTGGIDVTTIDMSATFSLEQKLRGEEAFQIDVSDYVNLEKFAFVDINSTDKTFALDIYKDNQVVVKQEGSSRYTATITIANLPKYASDGSQIEYTLKELSMGGHPFDPDTRLTVVDGYTYVSSLTESNVKYSTAGTLHSGDEYEWTGVNRPAESYGLDAYKVWRDDGSSKLYPRPDVAFQVYQISSATAYGNGNLLQIIESEGYTSQALVEALEAVKGSATKMEGDRFWNTKHNDWFWSCDIGTVPRYDGNGYPFIYFLQEKYTGSHGDYYCAYDNIPGDTPKSGVKTSTVEVLDTSLERLNDVGSTTASSVVILADGVHSGSDGEYGHYYSRTTVNYRDNARTVSGRKLWHIPGGWTLPDDQRPEIEVELWRAVSADVHFDQTENITALNERVEHNPDTYKLVGTTTLNHSTGYAFIFGLNDQGVASLPKYDEFGRTYFYFVTEKTVKESNNQSEDVLHYYQTGESYVTMNNFYIQNTYVPKEEVEITVTKEWTVPDGYGLTGERGALFTLYCQQVDASGNPIANTEKQMGQIVIKISEAGTTTGKFTGLPYYGPNDHPLKYWVVEEAAPLNGHGYTINASEKHDVTLTKDAATGKYTDTVNVKFTNEYVPVFTSFTLTKSWVDDFVSGTIDSTAYRPTAVAIDLHRSWNPVTINGQTIAGGSEVVKTLTLTETGNWTVTENNTLPKYAPSGAEYTYYVVRGEERAAGNTDDEIAKNVVKLQQYTNTLSNNGRTPTTLTNTLRTVSVTVNKQWRLVTQNGNEVSLSKHPEAVTRLQKLGALPTSITFVLQRSTDGVNWEAVPSILGQNFEKTFTISNLNNLSWTVSKLPANMLQLKTSPYGSVAYQYRFAEKLTWQSGNVTWYYADGDTHNSAEMRDPSGPYAAERVTKTVSGNTTTFTNTIPVYSLTIDKTWDDYENRDNTRPDSITLTLALKSDATKTFTVTINNPNKGNDPIPDYNGNWTTGNVWTTGTSYIYLPAGYIAADSTETMADRFNELFVITEATVTAKGKEETYTWVKSSEATPRPTLNTFLSEDGKTTLTFHLENKLDIPRELINITATKTFSGDDNWAAITRPTVRFTLYYKDPQTNSWTPATDAFYKLNDDGTHSANVQTVVINANNTGSVSYNNLYKYWDAYFETTGTQRPAGVPALIEYRVIEEMGYMSGETWTSLYSSLTANSTNTTSYASSEDDTKSNGNGSKGSLSIAAFTNTLVTKTFTIHKEWKYTDGTAISATDITKLVDLGFLPESIRFTLSRVDGNTSTVIRTQDIAVTDLAAQDQTWSFNLPQYNLRGEQIQYQISETSVKYKDATDWKSSAEVNGSISLVSNANVTLNTAYTVSLTNTLFTTSVPVEKVWDDNNNQDGFRPAKIKVILYANGVKFTSVELDAVKGWSYTFTHLPLNAADQTAIVYTVEEQAVNAGDLAKYNYDDAGNGGVVSAVGNQTIGYTFTNVHVPEKVSVSVTKTWNDNNDQDGKRPESTTVALYQKTSANGEFEAVAGKTATLSGGDNTWTYTFDDLDKYCAGFEIVYIVKEIGKTSVAANEAPMEDGTVFYTMFSEKGADKDSDYTVTYDYSVKNDLKITNKHTPEVVKVKITKIWNDSNNQDGKRVTLTFTLWATVNGTTTKAGELTLSNQDVVTGDTNKWVGTFAENLPKYEGGQLIQYTVTEDNIVTGEGDVMTIQTKTDDGDSYYTVVYSSVGFEEETGTYTEDITNTHTPVKVEFQVTKIWDDNNNQDGKRKEVTFQLYAQYSDDAAPVAVEGQTLTLNAGQANTTVSDDENSWTGKFVNLDKYRAGYQIKYSVKEVGESDGMIQLTGTDIDSVYSVTYTPNANDEYAETITNKHIPETVELRVTKIWQDNDNQDGKRTTVTFQLYKKSSTDNAFVIIEGKTVTVGTTSGDVGVISGLPKYANGQSIDYKVVEVGEANGKIQLNTEDVDSVYTVAYSVVTYTAATADTADYYSQTVTNSHTPETVDLKVTKIWDDNNNQDKKRAAVTFKLMAKYTADGEFVEVSGKTVTVGTGVAADGTVTNNVVGTFTGLTKYNEGFAIEYKVVEDGETNGTIKLDASDIDSVYTVTYSQVTHVDATATEGDYYAQNVTNAHNPETVEIRVTKIWDDENNQDGVRNAVTFQLYEKVGVHATQWTAVAGKTVTVGTGVTDNGTVNSVSGVIDNLPKYREGIEILYKVEEVGVTDGKIQMIEGNVDSFYTAATTVESTYTPATEKSVDYYSQTVTNSHIPETVDFTLTKVWSDKHNQDGKRTEVQFELHAKYPDGTDKVVGTVTLGTDDQISYTFTDLDKYSNGTLIEYYVQEVGESGKTIQLNPQDEDSVYNVSYYEVSYTTATATKGDYYAETVTNSHTPVLVNVSVTKEWYDKNNQDGKRNPVTIQLFVYDTTSGKDVPVVINDDVQRVVLDDTNNWTYSFEKLPKYQGGAVLQYSVRELDQNNQPIDPATELDEEGKLILPTFITNLFEDEEDPDIRIEDVDAEYSVAYSSTTDKHGNSSYTVTNTHTPVQVEVSVTKKWEDADDQDSKRPESITIALYHQTEENGTFTFVDNSIVTMAATDDDVDSNTWSYTYENLDKYCAGYQIVYVVKEVLTSADAEGAVQIAKELVDDTNDFYAVKGDVDSLYYVTYESKIDGAGNTSFEITNSHEPVQIKVVIAKAWDDADNQDGKRTAVSFQLFAQIEENGDIAPVMKDGEPVILTLTEEDLFTPPEIMPLDLEEPDGDNDPDNDLNNDPDDMNDETPVLTVWTGTIQGLMKYNQGFEIVYTLKELDAHKNPIVINQDEEGNPINNSFLTDPDDVDSEYTVEELRSTYMNGDVYYEFTNTHKPVLVDVKVTKVWDDADDQDGKRPEEITVALYRQTEKDGEFEMVKDSVVTMMASEEDEEDYIWTHTYEDLDKYCAGYQIVYTVKEVLVDEEEKVTILDGEKNILMTIDGDDESDYTVTYKENLDESGNLSVEITNTHETEEVKLVITKVWDDENDHDGARPESITVRLYATWADKTLHIDIPMDAKTLDEKGNWVVELIIDKYMDGEIVTYTVVELNEKGEEVEKTISFDIFEYTVKVEDMTITNSYTPAVTAVTVTKVWDDGSNWYLKRADEITVILYADGIEVARKTLTKENALVKDGKIDNNTWIWTFEGLDQYKDGKEIVYTVKEADEANGVIVMKANTEYKVVYSGNQKDGFKITNTYEFGRLGVPEGWIYDEVQGVWKPKQDPVKPNTGDNSRPDLWMAMMLVSFAGMLIVSRTKRKEDEE